MSLGGILFSRGNNDFASSLCGDCGARCCQDLHVNMNGRDLHVMSIGNPVFVYEDLSHLLAERVKGNILSNRGLHIYLDRQTEIYRGVLVGPCGNLLADGRCGTHREKPTMCREEPVGRLLCLEARAIKGSAIERL